MNQIESGTPRKPGVVIFVAILNFFSVALFFALSAFMALAIVFGAAWGVDTYVSQQMSQYAPNPNFSYGLTWVFGLGAAVCLGIALFFLSIAVGLLAGKKYAWYLQVAMSTLSLLGLPLSLLTAAFVLPLGAVLNIVILVFFFQHRVRDHFKV